MKQLPFNEYQERLKQAEVKAAKGEAITQELVDIINAKKEMHYSIKEPEREALDGQRIEDLIRYNREHLGVETHEYAGNSIQVCPNRGGAISSCKIKGKEIFYADEERRENMGSSLREGYWMFPQAGALKERIQEYEGYSLRQHGFARDMKRTIDYDQETDVENQRGYKISSNEITKEEYPHDFEAIQRYTMFDDKLVMSLNVLNTGDTNMLISPGHHTYYPVHAREKEHIHLDPKLGVSEEEKHDWIKGERTIKVSAPRESFRVYLPGVGQLELDFDEEFTEIRLWCEPGKDFVCIEPVKCHPRDHLEGSEILLPGENTHYKMSVKLIHAD